MLHSFLVCDVVEMRAILRYRRPLIGLATGLVVGLDYLNSATVNFAESAVRSGMGADANTYLWLLSSYAGAGVLGIALQERLSRQMRYRTLLLGGAGLFVLGSLLASLTSSFTALIIARIIQGFGGGPLLTCGRVMLQMNIHAKKRPKQLQGFMLGLFLLSARPVAVSPHYATRGLAFVVCAACHRRRHCQRNRLVDYPERHALSTRYHPSRYRDVIVAVWRVLSLDTHD